MDKKTILALLLILVVFWLSNKLLWKNPQKQVTGQPEKAVSVQKDSVSKIKEKAEPKTGKDIIVSESQLLVETNDVEIDNHICLQNDVMEVCFSNRGAVVNSIVLRDYYLDDKETNVNLIPDKQNLLDLKLIFDNGNSINLAKYPFSYVFDGSSGIVFTLETPDFQVKKIFRIGKDYTFDYELKVNGTRELANYQLALDSGISDTEKFLKYKSMDYKIITQIDNKVEKFKLSKLKKRREISGNIDWAAVRSKYFLMGIAPEKFVNLNEITVFQTNSSPAMTLTAEIHRTEMDNKFKLYFGPIIIKNLADFRKGFDKVLEGPFLEIIRPLANVFNFIFRILHKVVPNYGIVIILFAFLLKFILYPLTHKSFESSTKMQKIQPMMKAIQTKYKQNPRQMQIELKKLYKENGVSPLGGCLPMLLQMPIFFAIYPVIRYSIALRQTRFLWLPDLSEPDPIYILPIIMGIFMFVQQYLMSPSKKALEEMDEKQRATMQSQKMMMYVMPIIMFFIFKSLSSGLVLYWTLFSILSSVQQYFIKKKFDKVN